MKQIIQNFNKKRSTESSTSASAPSEDPQHAKKYVYQDFGDGTYSVRTNQVCLVRPSLIERAFPFLLVIIFGWIFYWMYNVFIAQNKETAQMFQTHNKEILNIHSKQQTQQKVLENLTVQLKNFTEEKRIFELQMFNETEKLKDHYKVLWEVSSEKNLNAFKEYVDIQTQQAQEQTFKELSDLAHQQKTQQAKREYELRTDLEFEKQFNIINVAIAENGAKIVKTINSWTSKDYEKVKYKQPTSEEKIEAGLGISKIFQKLTNDEHGNVDVIISQSDFYGGMNKYWKAVGSIGQITIELPDEIQPFAFSLEHEFDYFNQDLRTSAIKDFSVHGLFKNIYDESGNFQWTAHEMGNYEFLINKPKSNDLEPFSDNASEQDECQVRSESGTCIVTKKQITKKYTKYQDNKFTQYFLCQEQNCIKNYKYFRLEFNNYGFKNYTSIFKFKIFTKIKEVDLDIEKSQ